MRKKIIVVAGAILLGASVFAGCNKTETVEEEPAVEVVEEVVEEPVEEEVVEEEIEEPEVVEVELPELPLLDEDGNPYVPGMFTTEEVYAAIDKMVADNKFATRFERDFAIEFMITLNAPYISKETFETIKEDYCANITNADYNTFEGSYLNDDLDLYTEVFKTELPINYLFLDEKQGDAALQIVNYYNSDSYSREEYSDFALDYIEFSNENIGYNPINYVLYSFCDRKYRNNFVKRFDDLYELDDDDFNILFTGTHRVTVDDIGNTSHEIIFGDGGTYIYEPDYYLETSYYQYSYSSSHKE